MGFFPMFVLRIPSLFFELLRLALQFYIMEQQVDLNLPYATLGGFFFKASLILIAQIFATRKKDKWKDV